MALLFGFRSEHHPRGDRFVAGDWGTVDGADTPAVFRPSDTTFYIRHTLTQGTADASFPFGETPWLPVAGERSGLIKPPITTRRRC